MFQLKNAQVMPYVQLQLTTNRKEYGRSERYLWYSARDELWSQEMAVSRFMWFNGDNVKLFHPYFCIFCDNLLFDCRFYAFDGCVRDSLRPSIPFIAYLVIYGLVSQANASYLYLLFVYYHLYIIYLSIYLSIWTIANLFFALWTVHRPGQLIQVLFQWAPDH